MRSTVGDGRRQLRSREPSGCGELSPRDRSDAFQSSTPAPNVPSCARLVMQSSRRGSCTRPREAAVWKLDRASPFLEDEKELTATVTAGRPRVKISSVTFCPQAASPPLTPSVVVPLLLVIRPPLLPRCQTYLTARSVAGRPGRADNRCAPFETPTSWPGDALPR